MVKLETIKAAAAYITPIAFAAKTAHSLHKTISYPSTRNIAETAVFTIITAATAVYCQKRANREVSKVKEAVNGHADANGHAAPNGNEAKKRGRITVDAAASAAYRGHLRSAKSPAHPGLK